jgi:hypothetical protein
LRVILIYIDIFQRFGQPYKPKSGLPGIKLEASILGRYGQRTAEAMQTAKAMSQIRIAETFAHIISEHAGIVCASAIFSFGSVTGESVVHRPLHRPSATSRIVFAHPFKRCWEHYIPYKSSMMGFLGVYYRV